MATQMDVELRARHNALGVEFQCLATELRIVKSGPGVKYPRTIEAFCTEPRAQHFDLLLASFGECCAACRFFARRGDTAVHEPAAD